MTVSALKSPKPRKIAAAPVGEQGSRVLRYLSASQLM